MRKLKCFVFAAAAVWVMTGTAWAVDRDDDLKPDDGEHIGYDANAITPNQASEVEARFPEEAKKGAEEAKRIAQTAAGVVNHAPDSQGAPAGAQHSKVTVMPGAEERE